MKKLLVILLLPVCVFAQQDSLKSPDVFRFADGVLYTYSSPVRWKGKNWLTLGGVLAGTAVITLLDEPMRDFWLRQDNKFLDGVERVGFHYGKPYSAFAFTGGFYLAGVVLNNRWSKDTGLTLGTALLTSGLLQTFMKDAVGRARPGTAVGRYAFETSSNDPAYHSFPSGHAAVAFAISLVVARRTESIPIKIVFYTLAASTAASRMYSDAHWFSDITFGGTLAWFCANTAIERIQANRFKRAAPAYFKNKLAWKLYPYPGGLTLRASII